MENELNNNREKVSAEKRQILSMKSKMRWLIAGLVILILVAAGLLGMIYFPDTIQKITNIKISFGTPKSAVGTAYLGIEIRDLPKTTATSSLFSSDANGVLVSRVAPSSPAAENGIKAGDIILRYNRTRITDTVQFQGLVAESAAGERITLVVSTNNKTRNLSIVLAERPSTTIRLTAGPPSFSQDDAVEQWGCTLSPLTESLIQKLSVPSDITGIVVVSVSSTGLAKSSGILPGDLIVSVNQTPIKGMADFYSAIEEQKTITLKIFRGGSIIVIALEQKSALPPLVTIAGSVTAGMPTAGMTTLGAPEVVQGVAGLTVAGIPNISTQIVAGVTVAGMPTAGMTTAGPPEGMGQSTSGMPDTAGPPPGMGQSTAGMPTAGMPTAGAPEVVGQGVAGVTVAGSSSGKICIASNGTSINSQVADVFDQAPYFLIVGFGSMEVVTNPNLSDKVGSGVQSAQLVVSEGADVVITNDIGIRAIEELHRLQVKVYTGVTGTVKDALAWYQNNRLVPTKLNSSDSTIITDEEEQHGPPSASKSKSKGESTTL